MQLPSMSGTSPPSFDQFFNAQASDRQSSTSSSTLDPTFLNQQAGVQQHPYTDEPSQLHRRASQQSLHTHQTYSHHNSGDSSLSAGYSNFGQTRQESFPFDPLSSSTLIATAPLGAPTHQQHPEPAHRGGNIGEIMFSAQPQPFASEQQRYSPHLQQSYPEQQPPAWDQPHMSNQESYMYGQSTPNDMSAYTPAQQQQSDDWGRDFLSNAGTPAAFAGSYTPDEQNAADHLSQGEQDQFVEELERIISAASTPNFGPTDDPRAPSPFQGDHTSPYPEAVQQGASRSRSPSPFQQQYSAAPSPHAPSPANQRAGSTSPFAKPMSPPALIIPNSSSPGLPSLVTQAQVASQSVQDQGRTQSGQAGYGNSLMPPPNPNIPMSGMAGMSPINPSAGGPQIFVQPSTPISGLKDAKGVFDSALRKAALQQQQNQQQQGQAHGNSQQNGQDGQYQSQNDGQQGYYGNGQNEYAGDGSQQWSNGGAVDWQTYGLRTAGGARPRAKSESFTDPAANAQFDRQALLQAMAAAQGQPELAQALQQQYGSDNLRDQIDSWRNVLVAEHQQSQQTGPTLDPRFLPGQEEERVQQQMAMNPLYAQQIAQLHAQRIRLPALSTGDAALSQQGTLKYEPGEFSPTSLAFYQSLGMNPANVSQLGGTASAPYSQTEFAAPPPFQGALTANPGQEAFLIPGGGLGPRRRSFAEGSRHPASGAGTPGYGVEFQRSPSPFGALGVPPSRPMGHRRAVQSEDFGRPGVGTGWGVGAGGSTNDFLQSITAMDGSLLPPARGRSHSRHSSASSNRSPSPALSISSQGSSFSHHSHQHMDMPEGTQIRTGHERRGSRVAKMKVTSVATEVASANRRTNEGVFRCPSE